MFQTQEKAIDGIVVKVTPFAAAEAIRIQSLLVRIVGPAIGRAVGAIGSSITAARTIGDLNIDGEGLAAAIAEVASKLSEDELLLTLKRLFRGVLASAPGPDGKTIGVDFSNESAFENGLNLVFAGKTLSIYSVVAFVLRVNYPDFFEIVPRIGGLLGTILSSKKAGSEGDNASSASGSSGSSAQS